MINVRNKQELYKQLPLHQKWLEGQGGEKLVCADGADLSGADLSGANLSGADLSGANLSGADLSFANLSFANLRGADLSDARLCDARLCGVILSFANLSGANLRGADLCDARLCGVILSFANLSFANLRGADLCDARLCGADLRGAILPEGIPVVENIHRAVYEKVTSDPASFDMEYWHGDDYDCDTTHCRAGHVILLAGEAGRALEKKIGAGAAAALIYQASDPTLERIPNWHTTNEEALADMKRLAGM